VICITGTQFSVMEFITGTAHIVFSQSRVYETVQRQSICLVCPSMGHISNLYCCSPAGRRTRSTAGTVHSMQWANVGSATLSAYIVAKHTLVSTDSFFGDFYT